jgi:hypothetical protein
MAASVAALVVNDDETAPPPLQAQKTHYDVNGVTLSVDGYAYR